MFTQHTHGRWTPGMQCGTCKSVTCATYVTLECPQCFTNFDPDSDFVSYRIVKPTLLRQLLLLLNFQWPEFTKIDVRRNQEPDHA